MAAIIALLQVFPWMGLERPINQGGTDEFNSTLWVGEMSQLRIRKDKKPWKITFPNINTNQIIAPLIESISGLSFIILFIYNSIRSRQTTLDPLLLPFYTN